MNNKTRTITAASIIGGLLILLKLWHVATTINSITEHGNKEIENMPVTIITTDSFGNRDTMKMEDYLKKNKVTETPAPK